MERILLCICRITAEELSRTVYFIFTYVCVYGYIKIGKYYSAWIMENRAEFLLGNTKRHLCNPPQLLVCYV